MTRPLAVVRRPGPRLVDGLVLETPAEPVDFEQARGQWQQYVDALTGAGWTVIECPPADDCPDAVFIEDAVVMFGNRAVVCRPGAPSRRNETLAIPGVFEDLGLAVSELPAGVGTIDGGDVLKIGRDVYVGVSARTTSDAISALADLLGDPWNVVPVALTGTLHLKSAITALPSGEVIGLSEHVDLAALGRPVRSMPEPEGAHVVEIGPDHVLMSASAPESIDVLRGEGWQVTAVDISEYEKLDGCVTCLSVRLRR